MYNRYQGNTGRRERVPEPEDFSMPPPGIEAPGPVPGEIPPEAPRRPPPPPLTQGLGNLLRRFSPAAQETEDLLLLAVLWLLWRESGDREFLLMLGAYLFL